MTAILHDAHSDRLPADCPELIQRIENVTASPLQRTALVLEKAEAVPDMAVDSTTLEDHKEPSRSTMVSTHMKPRSWW